MKWFIRCCHLQLQILTLTATKEELLSLDTDALLWGLLMVWLAGIGRFWDDPTAELFQRSGLPSLIYIWVLALFLWIFILFLRPKNWSYLRLVTFISMTGMPAFLYAIPLEKMMNEYEAAEGNAMLLIIVACWRVLMLANYLIRVTGLNIFCVTVALLLPLMTIVNILVTTGTFAETFDAMSGTRLVYLVPLDEAAALAKYDKDKEASVDIVVNGEPVTLGRPKYTNNHGRRHLIFSYYRENNVTPDGFKEIESNDPEYLPPAPLLAFLWPLRDFCFKAWLPMLGCFVIAIIYGWMFRPEIEKQLGSDRPESAATPWEPPFDKTRSSSQSPLSSENNSPTESLTSSSTINESFQSPSAGSNPSEASREPPSSDT
jgi:hypothetical protein